MTAPGALPMRDDLIAMLSENMTWRSTTPEGPRATISPQWVERMADALLARLRPAWEQEMGSGQSLNVYEVPPHDPNTFHADCIEKEDALRADLRACAEALGEMI